MRRATTFAIVALLLCTVAIPVHATTIMVVNGNDSGLGSLRQAILNASSGDTINFAGDITTINLTSGELLINKNLMIHGPGANLLTVQRNSGAYFRIFNISSASITATVSGLTIANGIVSSYNGGGISNVGSLTISECTISGNSSLYLLQGGQGGGVYNFGLITITNCTISGNFATYGGGLVNEGRMTVTKSAIARNSSGIGGGIYNNTGGMLTVTNSTISNNVVSNFKSGEAGGIWNGGSLTITNSTISGNLTTGNNRNLAGGGIENFGTVIARNTIIALNTAFFGPDVSGVLTSQNFNLIGNNANATIAPQPADQIGTPGAPIDPLLGPLQNNGGPTETQALLSNSPAIDKGNSSGLFSDQRGFHRPVDLPRVPNATGGDGSDIGAFEFGASAPRGDFNGDGFTDYLLFNSASRATAIWYLNNNTYIGGGYGPSLLLGWTVVDVADFNGDGNPDYALFNPSTLQTAIWYLNNRVYLVGGYGPTLPSGWQLVGVGDFNGDSKPDYVLYNPSTRQTAIWYLNYRVYVSSAYGPTLPSGWQLVGIGDFNGDSKPDYVLYNPSTRQTAIWYLNNNVYVSAAYGPTIASGYVVSGVADFDSDGKPDYLLYNSTTRRTAIWYLNNNVYVSAAYGPTLPAGWSLVAP